MKQLIPNQAILVFRFLFQENRLRLSIPALYSFPGSLLQVKTGIGQSNSGSPPSLIYSLHSEYVYMLQSEQR